MAQPAKMKRALLVGASGFFGASLAQRLGPSSISTYRSRPIEGGIQFDATTGRLAALSASLPTDLTHVIVPFGAIDMEGCARDPVATSQVNVVAVKSVIKDALDQGLVPVFISTDYVFDGSSSNWTEKDWPRPKMAYGAQKLAVENWLGTIEAPWSIVRFSKVVSADTTTHSMIGQWINEVKSGKAQRCAEDQFFSPAHVDDLADAVVQLCEVGATGLFHAAGPQRFSRIDLLRLLLACIERQPSAPAVPLHGCALHDLPFLEKRPHDTSLCVDKLRDTISYQFRTMEAVCLEGAETNF